MLNYLEGRWIRVAIFDLNMRYSRATLTNDVENSPPRPKRQSTKLILPLSLKDNFFPEHASTFRFLMGHQIDIERQRANAK